MRNQSYSCRKFLRAAALLALCVAIPLSAWARNLRYTVTGTFPHDPQAFTQGLFVSNGLFYESTGQYGHSSLRKVEPATGKVLAQVNLDKSEFGEGLALWNGQLFQLTWQSHRVLLYDAASLAPKGSLPLETEGWGIASTPFGLVTSDGSSVLTWRDPATFRPVRTLGVTEADRPVVRLNELEWVEGFIFANVWHEDRIAVISPATGRVAAWIDCAPLRARLGPLPEESDLNGIAWDLAKKKLYVTGKLWPAIFELALEALPNP